MWGGHTTIEKNDVHPRPVLSSHVCVSWWYCSSHCHEFQAASCHGCWSRDSDGGYSLQVSTWVWDSVSEQLSQSLRLPVSLRPTGQPEDSDSESDEPYTTSTEFTEFKLSLTRKTVTVTFLGLPVVRRRVRRRTRSPPWLAWYIQYWQPSDLRPPGDNTNNIHLYCSVLSWIVSIVQYCVQN